MSRSIEGERRLPGQPRPSSTPQTPQFKEITRFSGVYLKEVWKRADEYLKYFPDSDHDELVSVASLKPDEQPRIDTALAAINQLSFLGINMDEVAKKVKTFTVLRQMTPTEKIIYEAVWFGGRPPVRQLSETPAGADQNLQGRWISSDRPLARESRIARKIEERKWQGEARAKTEELKEKNRLIEIIVDRGQETGESLLTSNDTREGSLKIELGEKGIGVILYSNPQTRNPDGTAGFVPIDRKSGEYKAGIHLKYKSRFQGDLLHYLQFKVQQLEGSEIAYTPKLIDPAEIEVVYEQALSLGLIKLDESAGRKTTGVEFLFEAFPSGSVLYPGEYVRIDLDRNVSEAGKNTRERPLKPQFTDFLRKKKNEADLKQCEQAMKNWTNAVEDALRSLGKKNIEIDNFIRDKFLIY